MQRRFVVRRVVVLAGMVTAAWLSASLPARGQLATASKQPKSTVPTPGGQPDIRGVWFKAGGNINEANAPSAKYTDECREYFGQKSEPNGFSNVLPDSLARLKPQYQPDPPRQQGIVDPADRVLPWRPEAAAARLEHVRKMHVDDANGSPYSLAHIEMTARCAPPGPWASAGNTMSFGGGAIKFLQRPGAVVMLYENDHASRTVYLDGRKHLGPAFRMFMGDSIGHWEGNTLVVDTTNLNGNGEFGRVIPYYSDAMHTIERFTLATKDRIDYEIVYDNPKLFTRPFTSVGYFFPADDGYEVREETCVEGSFTLRNIFGF